MFKYSGLKETCIWAFLQEIYLFWGPVQSAVNRSGFYRLSYVIIRPILCITFNYTSVFISQHVECIQYWGLMFHDTDRYDYKSACGDTLSSSYIMCVYRTLFVTVCACHTGLIKATCLHIKCELDNEMRKHFAAVAESALVTDFFDSFIRIVQCTLSILRGLTNYRVDRVGQANCPI